MRTRPPIPCLLLTAAALTVATGCGNGRDEAATPTPAAAERSAPEGIAAVEEQSAALNAWFEEQFDAQLARSPEFQTFLGRKTNYGKWDDASEAFEDESHTLYVASRDEMKAKFKLAALDPSAQLSYRLYDYEVTREEKAWPFRNHWYVFTQHYGPHTGVTSLLINQHRIDSVEDAEAYVERLEGVRDYLGEHQKNAESQFAKGIYPPKWSYPLMVATCRNIISGAPYDDGEPSALLADFRAKIGKLDASDEVKADLAVRAEAAMLASVKPAYDSLIAMFEEQEVSASNDDGAWKLPQGAAYYASQLEEMTTTNMTADQIHNLGLKEVARIHQEMTAIKEKVGFEGTLKEFFDYMREDPDAKFTYSNDDAGRERYLAEATALIDTMRGRLDDLFYTKPKANLVVKRVEPFREEAAGKAFYQRPAPDGSRPGIYYANLYDMETMPTYQMEALAYHEGIPGHHMQIAIAQELGDLPSFRKYGHYTAFSEGWGLYSEYTPKEMGFYEDPYSDFGRLAMELWRAARLVVDSGIHSKKWTREEAVVYLLENTPNPAGDAQKSIERYIAMPGQATAYKVGMLKILELRARAEKTLGDNFDVKAFHDVVLANGPVPLAILEENVDRWIAEAKA